MKNIVLNRQVAPHLSLYEFFKLANACGCEYVELRNDLAPFYQVCDNHTIEQVIQWLQEFKLNVLTINAVGHFNNRTNIHEFQKELESLCITAKAINCPNLVLCPACSPNAEIENKNSDHWTQLTKDALQKNIYPILKNNGITGFVEPLGFTYSSFRDISLAVDLIESHQDVFKLVLDTFHFYLFNQIGQHNSEFDFSKNLNLSEQYNKIFPHIGLVHLSSVTQNIPSSSISDNDRILLVKNDVLRSIEQIQQLSKMGFTGFYSLEPFSQEFKNLKFEKLQEEITKSIALITTTNNNL